MRSGVLIGGALMAAAALAGWLLIPGQRPPHEPTPIAAVPAPAVSDAPAEKAASDPPPPAAALRSPLAIAVSGVVAGGRENLALVSVDRGPEMLLRIGDSIGGKATVLGIDGESMTYRYGDSDVRVFVSSRPGTPATPAPVAPAPVKTYPGFVAAAPSIARASGAEPGSGNESFRKAVEKKLQAMAAQR